MKLVWSRQSALDLVELREWIARDNPAAAGAIAQRVLNAAKSLRSFPRMGRQGRRPGTRERIVPGTPYFLCYRVHAKAIEIVAVVHGARDWPRDPI